MYFELESVETITDHILALCGSPFGRLFRHLAELTRSPRSGKDGAKIFAFIRSEHSLDINLERETEENAVYINSTKVGISARKTSLGSL
jgi:glutamate dehydrogenase